MIRFLFFLILSIFLLACEKEYFPQKDAYRDAALFGTWVRLHQLNIGNNSVEVYNEDGYCGGTISYKNAQSNNQIAFQGIDGIWHVEQVNNKNDLKYNRIHSQKRFRNGIWKHTEDYFFINDTIFLRNIRYGVWDTLIKYKYQLKYDGPNYVGLDSIQ